MPTHAHASDIQHEPHSTPAAEHGHAHAPHEPAFHVPKWLLVAFAVAIVAGAALIFGRDRLAENATFDAMKDCDAKVNPDLREKGDDGQYVTVKPNGLVDGYALIRINKNREELAALFSLCDRADPAAGLRLFRRAFQEGNKNAKLVALHCANYLAHSQTTPEPQHEKGVLEAEDFNRMLGELDAKTEKDLDIRKVALHAVSDLVVITNAEAIAALTADPKAETRYAAISDSVRNAAKEALDADTGKDSAEKEKDTKDRRRELRIALHKDAVNGKPVLLIRWSTPGLALAWWKENAKNGAKWDKDMQRFVFP